MQVNSDENQLEGWLRALVGEVPKLKLKPCEIEMLEFGLRYLLSESKATRARRDHAGIKRVWVTLHPYLEKHQMLARYKDNLPLRNALMFFVKNGFGL